MLNIKRKSGMASLRYTMLAVSCTILGMIGITNGYTEIENCYDSNKLCRDYSVNESYNTNGTTISYGAYLNTPGYSKTFMVEYEYTNSSSITFKIRQYLFYNENGYYTIIQAFQRLTEPLKTSIYIYTGSTGYCIPEENNNRCGNATNSFKPYNKSIELVNSGINGSIMTGYRIMFYDNTPNLVHVICPMFENGFMFCMPFRQQTNNGVISNNANYGLPTRTNPYSDYIPPFDDRDYISSNYTISNTPFTTIAPQQGTEVGTPTGYDPRTGTPCYTIDQLIQMKDGQFNTGMCYSSNMIISGGTIQTVQPKAITELRTGSIQYKSDYNKYINYCTPPATNEACEIAFNGEEEKRSIINKAYSQNTNITYLYDYCNLYLNYSGDTNTCDLEIQEIMPMTYEDTINKLNEMGITQPASGSVYDNYKDDSFRDITDAIPSVISKITGLFFNNTGVPGIVPGRIVRIILLAVLFKLFTK